MEHEFEELADVPFILNVQVQSTSSTEELKDIFGRFTSVFLDVPETPEEMQARSLEVFPLDPDLLAERRGLLQEKISHLYHVMSQRNREEFKRQAVAAMGEEEAKEDDLLDDHDLQEQFNQICERMRFMFDYSCVLARMMRRETAIPLRELNFRMFFDDGVQEKNNALQKLLWFYWYKAHSMNLRKLGGDVFEPVENEDKVFVFAYRYKCDMKTFVFNSVYPLEQHRKQFSWLTNSANTASSVIQSLTNFKSELFPELERNRDCHTFKNGVYMIHENKFYWFERKEGYLHVSDMEKQVIGVKYHDTFFDQEGMRRDMHEAGEDTPFPYMYIKNKPLMDILESQGFGVDEDGVDEKFWILAMLGRLMFRLKRMDSWDAFLIFVGLAGTGKSTLLQEMMAMYEKQDVGVFNNQCQPQFALDGFQNKYMYAALDIDKNFKFDQTTWQSMVAGEYVQVNGKNKVPMEKKWDSPGAFAMNCILPWIDNSNSVKRRLFPVEFDQLVTKPNPRLHEQLRANRDRTLYMCVSAYTTLCCMYENENLQDNMPARFKKSVDRMISEMNSFKEFIEEKCALAVDEKVNMDVEPVDVTAAREFVLPLQSFRTKYNEFCRQTNRTARKIDYSSRSTFAQYGIKKITPDKNDRFGLKEIYLLGVKLRAENTDVLPGFGQFPPR